MATNIRVIHATDFIIATPDGVLDLERTRKLLLDVAAVSTSGTEHQILLDTRKVESTLTVFDLWHLAVALAQQRDAFSGKTAVLCPIDRFDRAEFFALCAKNRGFRVRAFTSFEEAIEWLIVKDA